MWNQIAIHTYRSTPKFGMKTSTLPPNIGYRNGYSSVSLTKRNLKFNSTT